MHPINILFVLASATPLVKAGARGQALRRQLGNVDNDSTSSSLSSTALTSSSSSFGKDQPSLTLFGTAPLGTGISPVPQTTQDVVITDVVYTTLTTCPVTSLVTSGSTSFEEITTTISTVTRTSTSTLCTKCVAPPSSPAVSSSSPRETAISSAISGSTPLLSQLTSTLPAILVSSAAAGTPGTGGIQATPSINTISVIPLQTAISSRPELPGTAPSSSGAFAFPGIVSLTVSATSAALSTVEFPGYGIVSSPISTPGSPRGGILSNATSSVIPVYTAQLLGNAYGGGFVATPSVFVTPLSYPNGPSSGVPPGYGSASPITVVENNVTVFTSLGASSTLVASLQSTTGIGIPAVTASIASNISALIGSPSTSINSPTSSESEGSAPTFISLSPFGGRVSLMSNHTAVPSSFSNEVLNSLGSTVVSSALASIPTGGAESSGPNIVTALVAATSPAGALSSEISQVSNAVLSSLAAAGAPSSSISVQFAVVGSSTALVIGSSGETSEIIYPTTTPVGGAAFPASSVPANTVVGVELSQTIPSGGVTIEATSASGPTSGEVGANIVLSLPAEQSAGPVVTLAVGPSAEQTAGVGQPAASTPTPIISANSTIAPTLVSPPVVGGISQTLPAGQPVASLPTPIIVASSSTAIAVVPSPVVGANGLTSLAVFSTPIAPAAGLTTPAVLLTPIVGANGLTSLAVLATPVIGANGLTSLAIGFEAETTPSEVQISSTPTPIEGYVLVQSPSFVPQASGGISVQAQVAATGVSGLVVPSGSPESPVSGGSGGGNYSIHVLLNPTAATHFQGSAVRTSVSFASGFFGFMVFLVLL